MEEPGEVEGILSQLGLSYEDLLTKLLKYKSKNEDKDTTTEDNGIKAQNEEEKSEDANSEANGCKSEDEAHEDGRDKQKLVTTTEGVDGNELLQKDTITKLEKPNESLQSDEDSQCEENKVVNYNKQNGTLQSIPEDSPASGDLTTKLNGHANGYDTLNVSVEVDEATEKEPLEKEEEESKICRSVSTDPIEKPNDTNYKNIITSSDDNDNAQDILVELNDSIHPRTNHKEDISQTTDDFKLCSNTSKQLKYDNCLSLRLEDTAKKEETGPSEESSQLFQENQAASEKNTDSEPSSDKLIAEISTEKLKLVTSVDKQELEMQVEDQELETVMNKQEFKQVELEISNSSEKINAFMNKLESETPSNEHQLEIITHREELDTSMNKQESKTIEDKHELEVPANKQELNATMNNQELEITSSKLNFEVCTNEEGLDNSTVKQDLDTSSNKQELETSSNAFELEVPIHKTSMNNQELEVTSNKLELEVLMNKEELNTSTNKEELETSSKKEELEVLKPETQLNLETSLNTLELEAPVIKDQLQTFTDRQELETSSTKQVLEISVNREELNTSMNKQVLESTSNKLELEVSMNKQELNILTKELEIPTNKQELETSTEILESEVINKATLEASMKKPSLETPVNKLTSDDAPEKINLYKSTDIAKPTKVNDEMVKEHSKNKLKGNVADGLLAVDYSMEDSESTDYISTLKLKKHASKIPREQYELEKLTYKVEYGPETVMDDEPTSPVSGNLQNAVENIASASETSKDESKCLQEPQPGTSSEGLELDKTVPVKHTDENVKKIPASDTEPGTPEDDSKASNTADGTDLEKVKENFKAQDKDVVRDKIREQLSLLRTSKGRPFDFVSPLGNKSNFSTLNTQNKHKDYLGLGKCSENCKSPDSEVINPTKTKDVTKIKGWKHKKFVNQKAPESPVPCAGDIGEASTSKLTPPDVKPYAELSAENVKEDAISAFASSNLDGFLESPDLKISYEIPKLTTDNTKKPNLDVLMPPTVRSEVTRTDELKIRPKLFKHKARTVAQKKKMLSEAISQISKENGVKPEAEVIKDSYIYFKEQKIKIHTRTGKDIYTCVAFPTKPKQISKSKKEYIYVPYYKRRSYELKHAKPSIFDSLTFDYSKPLKKIKYKPGPLSKKQLLQDEGSTADWKTVVKKLPNVYLEMFPEIGKPIHPNILHFVESNEFDVNENQIELALSVVQVKDQSLERKPVKFPIPYANNQANILMRYPIPKMTQVSPKAEEPVVETELKNTEDIVKDIVDKMLNYVQTKEVEDSIIKEDPDYRSEEQKPDPETSDKEREMSGVEVINRKVRRSKTCMELKRLNVKVITVDIEDRKSDKPCAKVACQLGCVCLSLNHMGSDPTHCGLVKCMFQCVCNFDLGKSAAAKVSLPHGTDLLSVGTLNRLQDEAKKDLAKVEKEFTQTVIQAKNQTIVVGSSRERNRRIPKAPKKYEDFVEDPDAIQDASFLKEQAESINYVEYRRPCKVNVTRLRLDDVVPFCMIHSKYDCLCLGEGGDAMSAIEESAQQQTNPNRPHSRRKPGGIKSVTYDKEVFCARTRGLSTDYYFSRNRSAFYKEKIRRRLKISWNDYQRLAVADHMDDCLNDQIVIQSTRKDRRKQSLLSREENDDLLCIVDEACGEVNTTKKIVSVEENKHQKELALQRRKQKRQKLEVEKVKKPIPQEWLGKIDLPVSPAKKTEPADLLGKTDTTQLATTMLKLSGRNQNAVTQLMPWSVLIENYKNGIHNIWFSPTKNSPKLLLTKGKAALPSCYLNIRQFENLKFKPQFQLEVVKWIVNNEQPPGKPEDVGVFLTQVKSLVWEIIGVCKKTNSLLPITKAINADQTNVGSQTTVLQMMKGYVENKGMSIPAISIGPIANSPKLPIPKLMSTQRRTSTPATIESTATPRNEVWYFKNVFSPKTLTDSVKVISAELPGIASLYRWRMITVSDNLNFIKLTRNNFTLKLNDFKKIVKMAEESKQTIVVHLPDKQYGNKDFGVYAVPRQSIVFVGPFSKVEDADMEVSLKNEDLNEVPWLYQADKNSKIAQPQVEESQIIDLTENDSGDESVEKKSTPRPTLNKTYRSLLKSMTPKNTKQVTVAKPPPVFVPMLTFAKQQNPSLKEGNDNWLTFTFKPPSGQAPHLKNNEDIFGKSNAGSASSSANELKSKPLIKVVPISKLQKTDKSEGSQETSNENVIDITITSDNQNDADIILIDPPQVKSPPHNPDHVMWVKKENKRYMITNLFELGYVEGYVVPGTKKFWLYLPGGSGLCFDTPEEAMLWFKEKLEKNILIVPRSFVLKVEIVKTLQPAMCKKFDQKWISGSYLIGSFGIVNFLLNSVETLCSLGLSDEEKKIVLETRMRKMMIIRLIQCAELFMPRAEAQKIQHNVNDIVKKCQTEIDQLKLKMYENQSFLKRLRKTNEQLKRQRQQLMDEVKEMLAARQKKRSPQGPQETQEVAPEEAKKPTAEGATKKRRGRKRKAESNTEKRPSKIPNLIRVEDQPQNVVSLLKTNSPGCAPSSSKKMETLASQSLSAPPPPKLIPVLQASPTNPQKFIRTKINGKVVQLKVIPNKKT